MAPAGRNTPLSASVNKLSKTALKSKKAFHTRLSKPAATSATAASADKEATEFKVKTVGGSKNGQERRVPVQKAAKYYPAEDVHQLKKSRKSKTPSVATLKKGLTPGTVLILLAGKFKGKRVVFLKQLNKSGLLLVTGPFKLNSVPLRRVNQSYVIATSTKLDLGSDFKVDEKLNDEYFKKAAAKSSKGSEAEFFKDGEKPELTEAEKEKKSQRSTDQKAVDKVILEVAAKTPNLTKYLASSFALSKGQYPHLMQF